MYQLPCLWAALLSVPLRYLIFWVRPPLCKTRLHLTRKSPGALAGVLTMHQLRAAVMPTTPFFQLDRRRTQVRGAHEEVASTLQRGFRIQVYHRWPRVSMAYGRGAIRAGWGSVRERVTHKPRHMSSLLAIPRVLPVLPCHQSVVCLVACCFFCPISCSVPRSHQGTELRHALPRRPALGLSSDQCPAPLERCLL